jgi:hypothetical protein
VCPVPLFTLRTDQHEPGQHTSQEWNSKVNEDAMCDLTNADVHH